MREWRTLVLLLAIGCFRPPDFPLRDEIPVVGQNPACAPPRDAAVACTVDGDTFDLDLCGGGERVRMLGIDAPEISHDDGPSDCFGDAASTELNRLLTGRRVSLSFDASCEGAFGRTLAYVWLTGDDLDPFLDEGDVWAEVEGMVEDGEEPALLVNAYMLSTGHARLYPEEIAGTLNYQRTLDLAEAAAKNTGRGLWGACESADATQ
jgi:endonuclease YncB( thermonuclease family)